MLVGELIKHLNQYDTNMEIVIDTPEGEGAMMFVASEVYPKEFLYHKTLKTKIVIDIS